MLFKLSDLRNLGFIQIYLFYFLLFLIDYIYFYIYLTAKSVDIFDDSFVHWKQNKNTLCSDLDSYASLKWGYF